MRAGPAPAPPMPRLRLPGPKGTLSHRPAAKFLLAFGTSFIYSFQFVLRLFPESLSQRTDEAHLLCQPSPSAVIRGLLGQLSLQKHLQPL